MRIAYRSIDNSKMDIFDGPLYKINKVLLCCVGLWPQQSLVQRIILHGFLTFLLVSLAVPQTIKLWYVLDDVDNTIECLTPLLTQAIVACKGLNCNIHIRKMKELLKQMEMEFLSLIKENDANIFKRYIEEGKKMAIVYTVFMYSAMWTYLILPLTPKILDIVCPLNETRPTKFLFYAEYKVDGKKYFWYILMHGYVVSIASISILIATDTLIIRYVQHAVAVFNVIGYRLRNFMTYAVKKQQKRDKNDDSNLINEIIHCHIVDCIKQHQNILKFADILESTYASQLFAQILINMFLMSITGVQTVIKLEHPDEVVRFAFFWIAQTLHLYYTSIPGQKLIDHSAVLGDSAYFGEWYNISSDSRKLLSMIILRSSKPCKLTGGKVYVLSIERFRTVLQASISYFTVLASLR